MNKLLRIAMSLLLMAMVAPFAHAGKKAKVKPFYDSKSWIVTVAGDVNFLQRAGLGSKISPVSIEIPAELPNHTPTAAEGKEIAKELTNRGFGKQYINALTNNGTSDEMLRQLATRNIQRQDEELGAENLRVENGQSITDLIADDYEPILTHNYIVLTNSYQVGTTKEGKPMIHTVYAIFRVDVTKEEAFDIVSSIGQPTWRELPNFPIVYCYSGDDEAEDNEKKIAQNVPDLAVRGVLLRRHPARISIGENAGLNKGDLVSIYSQRMDKDGNQFSQRISRARVCGVWEDEAQINFEANTAGNRKNGDVVVRTPDSHFRFGILATYSPHVWGGEILMDVKSGFTRSGIIHHTLIDLGFNMTDHPGDKFVVKDKDGECTAPMFANLGIGYGLGKTFLGFFDVMPYFIVQYEAGMMFPSDVLQDESKGSATFGSSIRVPVGVRFSWNIGYPVKLVLEAGYAFRAGFGDEYKIIKQACEYQNAKRDGIFVNLGFIF